MSSTWRCLVRYKISENTEMNYRMMTFLLSGIFLCTALSAVADKVSIPFGDVSTEQATQRDLLMPELKDYQPKEELHIAVVIISYNNKQWYERNLASIYAQDYKNYSVMYVDDASPDKTGELVKHYVEQQNQGHRTTVLINKTNIGTCANWYQAIHLLDPKTVVVSVDGDDWFSAKTALSLINKVYNKYDVLMTYGSYESYPNKNQFAQMGKQVPTHVIATNSFRDYKWVTSHLRTFKAGLFQRIQKEDLFYQGEFLRRSPDLGLMFPLLEMAGFRAKFIPDTLYVYNCQTPANEFKIYNQADIKAASTHIRASKRYSPLPPGVAY